MRAQTTPERRREFYTRHQNSETYQQIAEHYGMSKECVRYWCRRRRDGGSCESRYQRATKGQLSTFDPCIRESILYLRHAHNRWGRGRIRHELKKLYQGLRIPSLASIGRYLYQWVEFRRPRKAKKSTSQRPNQPSRVHQRWQIDFKLGIALRDGSLVNLSTVYDQAAGACLGAVVFPTQIVGTRVRRVTEEQLRSVLRKCFAKWGCLPEEIQTDGESVFIGQAQDAFPSRFTLWLTGLGIQHLVIRTYQPTDNAEVERGHRTVTNYGIIGNEDQPAAGLQVILDGTVYEQVFELPSQAKGCNGKPPIEAYPELLEPQHPFRPEHELALFDLRRVDTYLAMFTWDRKVSKTGQITLAGQHEYYSVGRQYAGRHVQVRFDPTDRHFVFYDTDEQEIGRRPARNLQAPDVVGLAPWPEGLIPQQLPLPLPISEGVNC
jgi:transposase